MGERSAGDNDADKRPRMYGRAESTEGKIEVTVQGGEGETSDDLEEQFDHAVNTLLDAQDVLPDKDDPRHGIQ